MEYLTLIPPVLAHGSITDDIPGGSYGPLILLGVAILLVAEKKSENRKIRRNNGG
jgi:hypothetical protein